MKHASEVGREVADGWFVTAEQYYEDGEWHVCGSWGDQTPQELKDRQELAFLRSEVKKLRKRLNANTQQYNHNTCSTPGVCFRL